MLGLDIGVMTLVGTNHLSQVPSFTQGGFSGEFSLLYLEHIPLKIQPMFAESGSTL